MQLTKDFNLNEFCRSETASRSGNPIVPSEDIIVSIKRLCSDALQPIRDAINLPMIITSGYRPPWLNKSIGGSATSAHMWGGAADFHVLGKSNYQTARLIAKLVPDLPIDQLIYEFGDWVHVGIAPAGKEPRREILTASKKDGKTLYSIGLIPQTEDVS